MATTKRITKAESNTGVHRGSHSALGVPKFSAGLKKHNRSGVTPISRRGSRPASTKAPRSKGRKRFESDVARVSFRARSKGNTIIALLKRKDGATIAELTAATGWASAFGARIPVRVLEEEARSHDRQ